MKTGNHWSDCAVHNMPAMPNGPCNCGAGAPPYSSLIGKIVKVVDGDNCDCSLDYTPDMKLLIGKTATIVNATADDVQIDIGDPDWGWRREWLLPIGA